MKTMYTLLMCIPLSLVMNYAWSRTTTKDTAILAQAVKDNNNDLVQTLLKQKVKVNPEEDEITPLMIAAEQGSIDIMKQLIKAGADVNAIHGWEQPHAGKSVLRYAIDGGSLEAVEILLKAGADPDEFSECPILISKSSNSANERNLTLLECAINDNASIDIIETLIQHGADVNKKSMLGYWTPLMVAAYKGYMQAVKVLLKAGADKTAKNKNDNNKTALDYAKAQLHTEIINLLK